AIERVSGLASPEARLGDPPAPPLGERHAQRVLRGLQRGQESLGGQVAAHLSHSLAEDGIELDPVPVTVDDWMVQARPDLCRRLMSVAAHVLSSAGLPAAPLVAAFGGNCSPASTRSQAIVEAPKGVNSTDPKGSKFPGEEMPSPCRPSRSSCR